MKVVVVSGSPRRNGLTQVMMRHVYEYALSASHDVTFINPAVDAIECYRGYEHQYGEPTRQAARALTEADVWLLGTPVYNSFFSSTIKNIFEYVNYKETAGKTAGIAILAAGQISFMDVQTMMTQLMSYFSVVTNPKAVYMTTQEIDNGTIKSADARMRLEEMTDNTIKMATQLYGKPGA